MNMPNWGRNARAFALLAALCTMALMTATAHAQVGGGDFSLSGDEPVQVDGDRLEVLEDEGIAVFEGNVRVVQGDTVLRTGRLVIRYARGGDGSLATGGAQIDRLEASGGVNIQTATQVATGETGTYDMASEVLTLSGKRVTLSEDGNVATGCLLTVDMRANRSRLEGCRDQQSRPTILIQPQNR